MLLHVFVFTIFSLLFSWIAWEAFDMPRAPLLDGVSVPGIRISSCFFARTEPLGGTALTLYVNPCRTCQSWSCFQWQQAACFQSPAILGWPWLTSEPRSGNSSWMCKKPLTWLLLSERPRRKKLLRRKDWLCKTPVACRKTCSIHSFIHVWRIPHKVTHLTDTSPQSC